jgi:hypothetical protein
MVQILWIVDKRIRLFFCNSFVLHDCLLEAVIYGIP